MIDHDQELEVITAGRATVTESPVWDDRRQALWWVDIYAGTINRLLWRERLQSSHEVGAPVTCLALREDGGLIFVKQDGIWGADVGDGDPLLTSLKLLAGTANPVAGTRFNDGKCDAHGRFCIGTLVQGAPSGSAGLYLLDPTSGLRGILTGSDISNGLEWSIDGAVLYYVDSMAQTVDVIEYNTEKGILGRRRTLIQVPRDIGLPDGLTVDNEGNIWLALSRGAQVRCYTSDGSLVHQINLPVSRVTSCAFGGPSMNDLFITSARRNLSETELAAQPLAGSVFRARPGAVGRSPRRFSGRLLTDS
jgi:sugar lactone lactonase YvrE